MTDVSFSVAEYDYYECDCVKKIILLFLNKFLFLYSIYI